VKIVEQTPGRLVVVHRNGGWMKLFAVAGALLFLGLVGLSASILIGGIGRGSAREIIIGALIIPFALVPVCLCLNALLEEHVFDFDRERDRFSIRERTLFGRRETAGRVSRVRSVSLKTDYSGVSVDTGPSTELIVRYEDDEGGATRTATCGTGQIEEDRRLRQMLKAFLKL
jgi:hypothetical protein